MMMKTAVTAAAGRRSVGALWKNNKRIASSSSTTTTGATPAAAAARHDDWDQAAALPFSGHTQSSDENAATAAPIHHQLSCRMHSFHAELLLEPLPGAGKLVVLADDWFCSISPSRQQQR